MLESCALQQIQIGTSIETPLYSMNLSLIIPAYNEAEKIQLDLEEASHFLKAQNFQSEILLVNDGSADRTGEVAELFSKRLSDVKVVIRVLEYGENRGKGYAIRYGVNRASGKYVAFADSGLCVPFKYLLTGMAEIDAGADFAIASRRLKETQIKIGQPLYRRWGSKIFWWVVKGGMGVDVSDTQCGFKIYSANAAKEIFPRIVTDGFMFDIEALLIAKKLNLKGTEFAVEWSNDSDTRYHPVWGSLRNFKELLRIRFGK